jgi:L-ribulose-5-phosphate 3-epimerase
MTEGWMQGDTATQEFFKPIKTFETRFTQMRAEIKSMGFSSLDLWGRIFIQTGQPPNKFLGV